MAATSAETQEAIKHAIVLLRRVQASEELDKHANRALESCEELLELYVDGRAPLKVVA